MNSRFSRYFLVMYDAAMAALSLAAAIALRFDGILPENMRQMYIAYTLLFIGLILTVSFLMNTYYSLWKYAGFPELLRQCLNVAIIGILLFALKETGVILLPNSVLFIFIMVYLVLSLPPRFWSRFSRWFSVTIRNRKNKNYACKNILIIGGGNAGSLLIERMDRFPEDGMKPKAVIDDDIRKMGKSINGIKIVGGREKISETVQKYYIDEIVISIPSIGGKDLREIYDICTSCHVPIKIIPNEMDFDTYERIGKRALKDIRPEDLLFRDEVHLDRSRIDQFVSGKTVMVTGGAGSIGSEICRQSLACECRHLIIFDIWENGLFKLGNELKRSYPEDRFTIIVGSVRDADRLSSVIERYRPQIVLHAAAHKHVPLMQGNPIEAIKNNIFGTNNVIQVCIENQVEKFILISTDKAVNPVNVMGATKRFAEILMQTYSTEQTEMAAVRFGNVLGSAGSVLPIFLRQIAEGGPVTVTHREIERYFMTIPEAVSLVLQTGALAKSGGIFVLDMGKPVKIYDLACDLIKLSGHRPHKDIEVKITGLRPGEKLFEELRFETENFDTTSHKKIFVCRAGKPGLTQVERDLNILREILDEGDVNTVSQTLLDIVRAYEPDRVMVMQRGII